jgi:hypothetical protein
VFAGTERRGYKEGYVCVCVCVHARVRAVCVVKAKPFPHAHKHTHADTHTHTQMYQILKLSTSSPFWSLPRGSATCVCLQGLREGATRKGVCVCVCVCVHARVRTCVFSKPSHSHMHTSTPPAPPSGRPQGGVLPACRDREKGVQGISFCPRWIATIGSDNH